MADTSLDPRARHHHVCQDCNAHFECPGVQQCPWARRALHEVHPRPRCFECRERAHAAAGQLDLVLSPPSEPIRTRDGAAVALVGAEPTTAPTTEPSKEPKP